MRPAIVLTLLTFVSGCVIVVDTDRDESRYGFTERSVHIEGVRQVVFNTHGRLHVKQSDIESLRVEGRGHAVDNLRIRQHGSVLTIDSPVDFDLDLIPFFKWTYPREVEVYLTVKDLESLSMRGHGQANVSDINSSDLNLELIGHGKVEATKIVADQEIMRMDGHGDISVVDLIASQVDAQLGGHGNINVGFMDSDRIDVVIRGHGTVSVAGVTDFQQVRIDGHGNYSASGLSSRSADVMIEGHGSADIWVKESLTADVERHGSVQYRGDPKVRYLGSNFRQVQVVKQQDIEGEG